jgi:hypothetical protein
MSDTIEAFTSQARQPCSSGIGGFKTCTSCGEQKAVEQFSKRMATAKRRATGKVWPRCKQCQAQRRKEVYHANVNGYGDRMRELGRRRRQAIRAEVQFAYGSACVCCGETTVEFLTIDHIHDDGAEERREKKLFSEKFYRYLKREGYPKDRYQLLCMNCNFAKGKFGTCPHQRGK